jgi:hypothetical protein
MWAEDTRLFWLQISSYSCVPKHFCQAFLAALAVCTGRKFLHMLRLLIDWFLDLREGDQFWVL